MTVSERQNLLVEDYLLIENSFERFQVLVDTAYTVLEPYPDEFRDVEHLVPGCVSRVWLAVRRNNEDAFEVLLDSEAPALRSIGALFCRVYSGGSGTDIVNTPPDFIERLSIDRHLTPTRLRGLRQIREILVERVSNAG
jgi:cysteine desulfuration protein SufE